MRMNSKLIDKKILLLLPFTLFSLLFSFGVMAKTLFNVTMTVNGQSKEVGYSKVEDLINDVKSSGITNHFPSYTSTSSLNVSIDFRGIPMTLTYQANSSSLNLSIPAIGVTKTFTGTDRDDTNTQFKNWLKRDGQDALNALMKKLVETSPYDPLAGNPTSLMSKMVDQSFSRGMSSNTGAGGGASAPATKSTTNQSNNLIGVGLQYGSYTNAGVSGKTYTLPLSYTFRFKDNPSKQLTFDLPLTYVKIEESTGYSLGLSSSYRHPVTESWSLTPSLGTGVVGSIDMGSMGQIVSGTLTSNYTWNFKEPRNIYLSLGNMVGLYRSLKLKIQGIESNPKITNTAFRNGLLLSVPHALFSYDSETELFLIDTRYFGSKLFMDQYNEVGFSVGSLKSRADLTKYLRLGLTYLFSSKTKGFTFNAGYSF